MGEKWVKTGTCSGNFPIFPCLIFPGADKSFLRGPLQKSSLQVSSGKMGEIQGLRRSPENRRLQRVTNGVPMKKIQDLGGTKLLISNTFYEMKGGGGMCMR